MDAKSSQMKDLSSNRLLFTIFSRAWIHSPNTDPENLSIRIQLGFETLVPTVALWSYSPQLLFPTVWSNNELSYRIKTSLTQDFWSVIKLLQVACTCSSKVGGKLLYYYCHYCPIFRFLIGKIALKCCFWFWTSKKPGSFYKYAWLGPVGSEKKVWFIKELNPGTHWRKKLHQQRFEPIPFSCPKHAWL